MVAASPIEPLDAGTVRDRLIRAAEAEIVESGINSLHMESVAARAGVSRATAFRQLGNVNELLVQVALLRARRHTAAVAILMATKVGALSKIQAMLAYTTRELSADPAIEALIAQWSASIHHPLVHQVAVDVATPPLREGQASGEIRTDLEIDELVDFLVEQTYLAAQDVDRSEAAVQRRFRHVVLPVLAAAHGSPGERLALTREAVEAVATTIDALTALADHLGRGLQPTTELKPRQPAEYERTS